MTTEIPPEIFYANRGLPKSNVLWARTLNYHLMSKCRRLLLQDQSNALRTTSVTCYPPISMLLHKLNLSRRIFNDQGITYGNDKLYWIMSNEEWNHCWPINTGNCYRFWDGNNKVIPLHDQVAMKKAWMQFVRVAAPDLCLSVALFANYYLKKQYEIALSEIAKQMKMMDKFVTDEEDETDEKFPPKYVLAPKHIRKIMYVDNAVVIANEQSPKHQLEPLVHFKFYAGTIRLSEDCIATKIGIPRNALKATLIDAFDDENESKTKNKQLNKLIKKEKKKHYEYEYNHDEEYKSMERKARISRLQTQQRAQLKYEQYLVERKRLRKLFEATKTDSNTNTNTNTDND